MPDEAETASEVNTPMKKRVRIESSSTEEQGEMEHVEKLPVPEKMLNPQEITLRIRQLNCYCHFLTFCQSQLER